MKKCIISVLTVWTLMFITTIKAEAGACYYLVSNHNEVCEDLKAESVCLRKGLGVNNRWRPNESCPPKSDPRTTSDTYQKYDDDSYNKKESYKGGY